MLCVITGRRAAATEAGHSAAVAGRLDVSVVCRNRRRCDPANLGSPRVLEKSGLTFEGLLARWEARPNLGEDAGDSLIYVATRPHRSAHAPNRVDEPARQSEHSASRHFCNWPVMSACRELRNRLLDVSSSQFDPIRTLAVPLVRSSRHSRTSARLTRRLTRIGLRRLQRFAKDVAQIV